MKNKIVFALLVVFWLVFALAFYASVAGATDIGQSYPDGVEVFELPDGQTCVKWPDGSGDCYCPCDYDCDLVVEQTPTPPTDTPPPPPTTEVPTDRPNCNRGIGNGSEDCDPGNSYGQGHGGGRRAGEDREE